MRGGRRVVLKMVRYSAGRGGKRYAKRRGMCKKERVRDRRKRETGEREGCTVSTRKT